MILGTTTFTSKPLALNPNAIEPVNHEAVRTSYDEFCAATVDIAQF